MGLHDAIRPAVRRNAPSIALHDSLHEAITKITRDNSSALVVKNGEELLGIVSDMDLMYAVANNIDLDDSRAAHFMTACELITDKPVKSPCVQLYEGESVKNALDVMSAAGVHNLLVTCETGVGTCMVSIRDLLRLLIS